MLYFNTENKKILTYQAKSFISPTQCPPQYTGSPCPPRPPRPPCPPCPPCPPSLVLHLPSSVTTAVDIKLRNINQVENGTSWLQK
jgi:hypothetical protein